MRKTNFRQVHCNNTYIQELLLDMIIIMKTEPAEEPRSLPSPPKMAKEMATPI